MDLRLPEPDASGFADVAGVRVAWESFGRGEKCVVVVPTWNFVDSRLSANLVPELSRSFRVITYDPRGAGQSDRPRTGYRLEDHLADAIAVMQEAGAETASLVAGSIGADPAALLAARQPSKVERLVLIGSAVAIGPDALSGDEDDEAFWTERSVYEGWDQWSAPYWRQDWPGFVRWFLGVVFNEPDSVALIEAVYRIALDADPEILIRQHVEMHRGRDGLVVPAILGAISSPTLVIHGEFDRSVDLAVAEALAAKIPGATLAVAIGGGHRPDVRSPELINPVIVDFLLGHRLQGGPGIEIWLSDPRT